MYFDGCASHLGCTVTLRGGGEQELRKVYLLPALTRNIAIYIVACQENGGFAVTKQPEFYHDF